MKRVVGGLRAVHDFAVAAATSGTYAPGQVLDTDLDGQNRTVHPVVVTHPENGRKTLFVNPGFTAAIEDFSPAESQTILTFLYDHSRRHELIYRHRWARGDLVVWDNRSLMHYAVIDYEDARYLHRTTVIAEQPS